MKTDWNALYRTLFPELVRYLHRKVWDEERARDLAQEAFVRALRDEPDRPRAWLFTVASNLAKDEARTVLRRKRHLTLLKTERVSTARQEDPARDLAEKERHRQVQGALETLSERDRELLLLWDAGMNYDEIAAESGLAVGAVGTSLARARKRLVTAFESMERDDAARHGR